MTVTLRSINLDGVTTGVSGILITNTTASTTIVHVLDVNIEGFQNGINVTGGANVFLTVKDTQINDNSQAGIATSTSAGIVAADFDHVSLYFNIGSGINAGASSHVLVHNSTISLNTIGINESAAAAVLISDSVMALNTTALQSSAGGTLGTTNTSYLGNATVFF